MSSQKQKRILLWGAIAFAVWLMSTINTVTGSESSPAIPLLLMAVWAILGIGYFRPDAVKRLFRFGRPEISDEDKALLAKATEEVDRLLSSTGTEVSKMERVQLIRESYWTLKEEQENEKATD